MSTSFACTAGPWETAGQYVRTHFDGRSGGWMIADCRDVSMPRAEVIANAQLIAAAPDLLDVAMAVLDHARAEMPQALIDAAQAAVTKATGATP